MRHFPSLSLSLFAMTGLLTLAAGCAAQAPTTPFGNPNGTDMARTVVVPDMAPVDPGTVLPPVLDAIEQTTPYDTIPVHGTAQPNTSVLFESDDGETVTVDVCASGRFCVDAPLSEGQSNNFHVSTIDKFGNQSTRVDFSVTQDGQPQQQQAAPQAKNAAIGGQAKSNYLGSQPDANANDGSSQTAVQGRVVNPDFWSWNGPDPSVVVKLASPSRINKIIAIAPSDCLFKNPLQIWYTASDSPSPPNIDQTGWHQVSAQNSADMSTATATIASTVASHVAVVWHDGATDTGNCGTIYANFGLAELQAWTVPNEAPPAPHTPMCTGCN